MEKGAVSRSHCQRRCFPRFISINLYAIFYKNYAYKTMPLFQKLKFCNSLNYK
jgi:hypothetical protein